jgi:two-component system, cell cycle sensor histidine kinase and response regulator CckA
MNSGVTVPSKPGGSQSMVSKTILVVDDEDKMRKILRLGLTGQGLIVLEAAGGDEALRVCKDYQGPIHLLLADVVMPGMSGVELAPQIMALRRDIIVILMSGYRDDHILLNAALNPNTPFFHKPFTLEDLVKKIRELLKEA